MRLISGETHPEMRESREPIKGYATPDMSLAGDIFDYQRNALQSQFLTARHRVPDSAAPLLASLIWEARHD